MQGVQKLKCSACGVTFMAEADSKVCPSCASSGSSHGDMGGCGCGHHH
ncbi:MAG: hypothetical protein ACREAY_05475 [Nitrososphaera sp.]